MFSRGSGKPVYASQHQVLHKRHGIRAGARDASIAQVGLSIQSFWELINFGEEGNARAGRHRQMTPRAVLDMSLASWEQEMDPIPLRNRQAACQGFTQVYNVALGRQSPELLIRG